MAFVLVPEQSGGYPWAKEIPDFVHGFPSVSRIPTGGWRGLNGLGAIPSHAYPEPATIPGFWRGLGYAAGTTDAAATKTGDETTAAITAIATSLASAYSAERTYQLERERIRRGLPPSGALPAAGTPAPAAPGQVPWGMIAVGAAVLGGAFFFMRR